MQMGIRLGRQSAAVPFHHNDLASLEAALARAREAGSEQIFVAVEALYSMNGDEAPLVAICEAAAAHGACVIVDEAHSTGLFGSSGRGLVNALGLDHHPSLLTAIHTFGKAMGCHGAAVLGPSGFREYLLNYSRPLIYSTSLPLHSVVSIRQAHELMMRR